MSPVPGTEAAVLRGWRPGAIGRITEMHGRYYARQWGFDMVFERQIAADLADFLGRYDESRDGLWLAIQDGDVIGSIAIDGTDAATEGAHLCWFIVAPEARGIGLGAGLLRQALSFCDARGYARVYLWTFAGLDAARHLYEQHGFRLCHESAGDRWGTTVTEQLFERSKA